MSTEHTPLPWHVVTIDGSIGSVEASDGSAVAQAQMRGTLRCPDNDERRANAEFIVRACNSHGDLLEALEMLMPLEPSRYESDSYDRGMWENARAAIAKAKGESP